MSAFRGSVTEYPGVIIDRFTKTNCQKGRVFFLSHCHKDHMSGLDSDDIIFALEQRHVKFYTSQETLSLLQHDPVFNKLTKHLEPLPLEEPISLTLDPLLEHKTLRCSVTLLPAGHCPGSVMFLIQGEYGNVLYTGDFRLTSSDISNFSCLHDSNNKVIDIRTLYCDTTFCHPKAFNIPTRSESRDMILSLADQWLSKNSKHVLYVDCPTYGYEHIIAALSGRFSTKVHIPHWKMAVYDSLPSLRQCITDDSSCTRIHACGYRKKLKSCVGLPCRSKCGDNDVGMLVIRPSAQWFVTRSLPDHIVYFKGYNMYRVIHSMHASFSELTDVIKYLSPSAIVPCVIPRSLGDTTITDVHSRLRGLLGNKPAYSTTMADKSVAIERGKHKRKCKEYDSGSDYDTDDELVSSAELYNDYQALRDGGIQDGVRTQCDSSSDSDSSLLGEPVMYTPEPQVFIQTEIDLSFDETNQVTEKEQSPIEGRGPFQASDNIPPCVLTPVKSGDTGTVSLGSPDTRLSDTKMGLPLHYDSPSDEEGDSTPHPHSTKPHLSSPISLGSDNSDIVFLKYSTDDSDSETHDLETIDIDTNDSANKRCRDSYAISVSPILAREAKKQRTDHHFDTTDYSDDTTDHAEDFNDQNNHIIDQDATVISSSTDNDDHNDTTDHAQDYNDQDTTVISSSTETTDHGEDYNDQDTTVINSSTDSDVIIIDHHIVDFIDLTESSDEDTTQGHMPILPTSGTTPKRTTSPSILPPTPNRHCPQSLLSKRNISFI